MDIMYKALEDGVTQDGSPAELGTRAEGRITARQRWRNQGQIFRPGGVDQGFQKIAESRKLKNKQRQLDADMTWYRKKHHQKDIKE